MTTDPPQAVLRACRAFGVTPVRAFADGHDGGAWLCEHDGRTVVVKLDADDATALALSLWSGRGAVRLLDRCDDALLLERLRPGTALSAATGDEQVQAAAQLTSQLWHSDPPAGVPALPTLCAAWQSRPCPPAWRPAVRAAAMTARELLNTAPADVLLHGDLHPGNVLADGGGWRAIDPQPVRGEAAFDVEPLLRRYLDGDDPSGVQRLLAAVSTPADRALAWARVRAVWYGAASAAAGDTSRAATWWRRLARLQQLSS